MERTAEALPPSLQYSAKRRNRIPLLLISFDARGSLQWLTGLTALLRLLSDKILEMNQYDVHKEEEEEA